MDLFFSELTCAPVKCKLSPCHIWLRFDVCCVCCETESETRRGWIVDYAEIYLVKFLFQKKFSVQIAGTGVAMGDKKITFWFQSVNLCVSFQNALP